MKINNSKTKKIESYMSLPYSIKIIPQEEGGYFAKVEELRGCMTQGDSLEETLRNIEDAKRGWLTVAIKKGIEIPLPEETKEYSGKFLIRVPKYIHERLAIQAKKEGISLNHLIVSLLSERITIKEIKTEVQTAIWEMKNKTEADYKLLTELSPIISSDIKIGYNILSEKRKIPRGKWLSD